MKKVLFLNKEHMKKRIIILSLLLPLLGGCVYSNKSPERQTQKEAVVIGYIGPQSGDSAIIGEANLEGVRLAFDQLKQDLEDKYDLQLKVEDDQFDEKQTISAYQKLTTFDGADYILTATYGGVLSLAQQAQNDGKILINSLDSSEELAGLSDNTFAIGIYDESIGYTLADYLNKEGKDSVGVIILKDPFTELVKGALQEKFSGKIIEVPYTGTEVDYRSMLLKTQNTDALVLLGWEETGRIVKQARELGMTQTIVGIDTFASEDFRKNTQGSYNGLKFAFWTGSQDNMYYADLLKKYKEVYNKEPENILFTATGYDSMRVLGLAIEKCGKDVSCVAENIANTKDFPGATGSITLDKDHITRSIKEFIHYYSDGQIKELKNL